MDRQDNPPAWAKDLAAQLPAERTIAVTAGRYVYVATDFHLGSPAEGHPESRARERRLVAWLEAIAPTAQAVLLLGDTFDFWYEYATVAPRGYTRLLGALGRLTDAGISVVLFTGNHDMWMWGYLPGEIGVEIIREPTPFLIGGRRYLIGHGDGVGPGDGFYKFLKKVFANKLCQWAFRVLHPDVGMWIAHRWSSSSRAGNAGADAEFKGEAEHIWAYTRQMQGQRPFDYYLFGHRHLRLRLPVAPGGEYINLGDWFTSPAQYARIGDEGIDVKSE